MTKYWDAGKVKTRLGAAIGLEQAAEIHRLFVAHLCASLGQVADQNIACLSPDHMLEKFQTALAAWGIEHTWRTVPQGDGTLGARMQRWFIRSMRDDGSRTPTVTACAGPPRSILIGADCPTVKASQIEDAGELLRSHDAVLGPAADGGYYLIGLRGPWDSHQASFETLFRNIPWSTEQVLSVTRERLNLAGLSFIELETREDVDTIVELNHLRTALLAGGDPDAELGARIERVLAGEFPLTDHAATKRPTSSFHE